MNDVASEFNQSAKCIGMYWNLFQDCFQYEILLICRKIFKIARFSNVDRTKLNGLLEWRAIPIHI